MATLAMNPLRVGPLASATRWATFLAVWQGFLAIVAVVALLLVTAGGAGPTTPIAQTGAVAALSLATLATAASIPLLWQRRHIGRTLALAVNYLGFVMGLFALLQLNGVFVGLDTLAARFMRAVPFLAIVLVAFVVTGMEPVAKRWPGLVRSARLVAGLAVVAGAVSVGVLPGLVTFVERTLAPGRLALVTGVVVLGLVAARTYASDVAREFAATARQGRTIDGLLFVSPNLLGFLFFFAGPLLFSLFVSLNDWDAFGSKDFIGLGNYAELLSVRVAAIGAGETAATALPAGYRDVFAFGRLVFGARDPLFWTSLINIIKFALLAIPMAVVPALFLAQLLNSRAPGIKVFRSLFFVPSIAGVVAVALIWRQLFNSTVGWINYLLVRATDAWNALPLLPDATAPQPQWLSDADIALFSLVVVFAWQYVGFNTVLFLAGLQGVDTTLHEAAMIDGANRWQRFRNVTLPQLAPTTFFVVAQTGILALQLFGENVVLFPTTTPVGAGPVNSTMTPVVYLYEMGFRRFSQGYASAVAWLLFLMIFAFTYLQFRRQREATEASGGI